MVSAICYPSGVSVYEAVRTHPGAMARLEPYGVTREHFAYSLAAAARELRVPVERLTATVSAGYAGSSADARPPR